MKAFQLYGFGLEHLRLESVPEPKPEAGQVLVQLKAISLNYRDLLVINGLYNPKLRLPVIPISDGAGVVEAVGSGVTRLAVGDGVVTHFVPAWIDGPFQAHYPQSSLGTPGPGVAANYVVLPEQAILKTPAALSDAEACTLPIAALTAWSCLMGEGTIQANQTVLALGTGGVSIFALQIAKSLGAKVIIISSSDEKLAKARALGADGTINYRVMPDWDRAVMELTGGVGADLTIETGGAGTFERSLRATKAGGTIAFLGALTGLKAEINLAGLLMKRIRVVGIYVDCRAQFERMLHHIQGHRLKPIIDRIFEFEQLPEALRTLEQGQHFGKIVVRVA